MHPVRAYAHVHPADPCMLGDLAPQALTLRDVPILVLRELPGTSAPGVGVCVSTLRASLAAARGVAAPALLDDLEALACFTLMGNDCARGQPSTRALTRGLTPPATTTPNSTRALTGLTLPDATAPNPTRALTRGRPSEAARGELRAPLAHPVPAAAPPSLCQPAAALRGPHAQRADARRAVGGAREGAPRRAASALARSPESGGAAPCA